MRIHKPLSARCMRGWTLHERSRRTSGDVCLTLPNKWVIMYRLRKKKKTYERAIFLGRAKEFWLLVNLSIVTPHWLANYTADKSQLFVDRWPLFVIIMLIEYGSCKSRLQIKVKFCLGYASRFDCHVSHQSELLFKSFRKLKVSVSIVTDWKTSLSSTKHLIDDETHDGWCRLRSQVVQLESTNIRVELEKTAQIVYE